MPAHGGRRLLILQGIEFFTQRGRRLGQHRRRDGDIDQFAGRPGQQRPIADGKEAKAEIGELPIPDDRLRCQADDRVVAMSAGELMKEMRRIIRRHRQFNGDQQFLRRKRRLVDAGEELASPQSAARHPARER